MGLFKQMKEMKDMVHAAPGMIDQANQMSANAQAMAAAQQQAGYQQAAAAQAAADGTLQPQPGALDAIAGVSLQQYAVIVKAIAPLNYDQSALPGIAASHGIDSISWQQAHDGWNARIQGDPAVARAFSDIYRGV
ncbi:MAG: hypothetical protein LH616_14675 [Ilumatobacteraceae bacterium]|nr:hypothetical protein [Ilumatobacteraceae bacterium]